MVSGNAMSGKYGTTLLDVRSVNAALTNTTRIIVSTPWTPANLNPVTWAGTGVVEKNTQPNLLDGPCQDVSKWPAANAALLSNVSGGVSGNCMRVAYNGTDNPFAYQDVLIQGNRYAFAGNARRSGGTSAAIFLGVNNIVSSVSAAWEAISAQGEALSSNLFRCYLLGTGAGAYAEFDSLTLTNLSLASYTPRIGAAYTQETPAYMPWEDPETKLLTFAGRDCIVNSASANTFKALHDGTGCTLVICVKVDVLNAYNYIFSTCGDGNPNLGGALLGYDNAGHGILLIANGSGAYDVNATFAMPVAAGNVYVFTLRTKTGADGVTIRQNSVARYTGTLTAPSAAAPSALTVGAPVGGAAGVYGKIRPPLVVNRYMNDEESLQAERFEYKSFTGNDAPW